MAGSTILLRAAGFTALAAAALQSTPVRAEEPAPALVEQFVQVCGTTQDAGPALPGTDVAAADAPGFFAGDLQRAEDSRVVKVGERYAMRALVPASADPQHAVFMKCALAGPGAFSEQVDGLSARVPGKPTLGKTAQGFDYALFLDGATSFAVYAEPDGWVSMFKMDIMMRNIDRKYLKKGAKPQPIPPVR